jgi:ABC-2 type transport system ATP-binding protein
MSAIEVRELAKRYGRVRAVDGVSFCVPRGAVFGMLGPNGAGKTTTIECTLGLKKSDAGSATVLGMDPARDRRKLFRRVGVQLQEAAYADRIKVWELCGMFASMYGRDAAWEPLLEKLGIAEKRDAYYINLSGGQKQKLSILLALLPDPEAVFLDELTTGLDPNARRAMWRHVLDLKEEGRTVFMTTHYMEEAEHLCDTVAIIDRGRIIASGTVEEVIASCGLGVAVTFESEAEGLAEKLEKIEQVYAVERKDRQYSVRCAGERAPGKVIWLLESQKTEYTKLGIARPTLDDAYVKLTGKSMREEEDEKSARSHAR